MRIARISFVAATLAVALVGPVAAAALPACQGAELANAKPAPMPKTFESLLDVTTNKARSAGYLIDIDARGHPNVRCAIDEMTYPTIRETAAEALAAFEYWPADSTSGGPPQYVHLKSGTNGLKIPSVLPRKDDPPCNPYSASPKPPIQPIYRPTAIYPAGAQNKILQGEATIVVDVGPTGAVQLNCQAIGDVNVEWFKMAAYYYAAQFRFPAEPGRPILKYSVTVKYRLE